MAVNPAEVATPLALVVAVFTPPAKLPLAPVLGAVNVTVTPLTGFDPLSRTVTTSGNAKAALTAALCAEPLVAVTDAATPALFVKLKVAGVDTPAAVALTVYVPAVLLAVNAAEVATPFASVVAVLTPPANVPLAPVLGAVKVTVTPLTGLDELSFTVTTKGAENAPLTATLCEAPLVAVIDAAAPAALVRLKFAVDPEIDARTVYAPAIPLAVKTAEVATPLALVVAVLTPPANVPLAPVDGAVKVTITPLVGDPPVVTVATSEPENAAFTVAV